MLRLRFATAAVRADELVSPALISDKAVMPSAAHVVIHPSQFPEVIQQDLLTSLRTRKVNHKFHYDSPKQTLKWLALHQAHSPARNDADCLATYDAAFAAVSAEISSAAIHVLGLGCGGGQKDTRLLELLRARGKEISYTPSDVSTAMVLVARATASSVIAEDKCQPLVCDLATATDLGQLLERSPLAKEPRLVTFFGMIPNFEPAEILPKLAALVRKPDGLLFSANLAPGPDYTAGVRQILPQYDNILTREWLMAFLLDLGVESSDGEIDFEIEDVGDLKHIVARFRFRSTRTVSVGGELVEFKSGESIRLFYSYRYTPGLVKTTLAAHGLRVERQWVTQSGEEGVFLCRRSPTSQLL